MQRKACLTAILLAFPFLSQPFAQTGTDGIRKGFQVAVARYVEIVFGSGSATGFLQIPGVNVGQGRVVTLSLPFEELNPTAMASGVITLNGTRGFIERRDPSQHLMLLRFTAPASENVLPLLEIADPKAGERLIVLEILGDTVAYSAAPVLEVSQTGNRVYLPPLDTRSPAMRDFNGSGLFSRSGALVGIVFGQGDPVPGRGARTGGITGAAIRAFLEKGAAKG